MQGSALKEDPVVDLYFPGANEMDQPSLRQIQKARYLSSFTQVRVRVTNRLSGRSKDLVVKVDNASNLYESVYNEASLKAANIRKWHSKIVKEVKSKQSEIQCLLWNESAEESLHTFSIDDLRDTSTLQLVEISATLNHSTDPNRGLIQLVLQSAKINPDPKPPSSPSSPTTLHSDVSESLASPSNGQSSENKKNDYKRANSARVVMTGVVEQTFPDAVKENDNSDTKSVQSSVQSMASTLGGSYSNNEDHVVGTMRIRITNDISGRFKDLVVNISDDVTIFDAIYDNHAVKKANVRKWSSEKVREVKHKTSQILCSVMDKTTGKPFQTYSITDMKNTSTKKLNEYVGESSNLIKLLLSCEKKIPIAGASSDAGTLSNSHPSFESLHSAQGKSMPTQHGSNKSQHPHSSKHLRIVDSPGSLKQSLILDNTTIQESTQGSATSIQLNGAVGDLLIGVVEDTGKSNMRVRVENETTGRAKDLLVKVDKKLNLFDEVYNNKTVKDANVRKWGSEIAQEVKDNVSEIKCLVWDESIQKPFHTFTVDDLKNTSTKKLCEIAAEPRGVIKLILRCEKKKPVNSLQPSPGTVSHLAPANLTGSTSSPTGPASPILETELIPKASPRTDDSSKRVSSLDDIASVKSKSMAELESLKAGIYSVPLDTFKKETIRVRILNEKTKRSKDLVVDVRNDLMLYTAVYDNKAVKEANVRKWGSNIARDVKSGVSEIQLILWDEKVGGPIRVYSIESLKSTSTKDLVEIAPETMNLIPLHLQCVKHEIDTVTTIFPTLNKTIDGSEHSNPSKVYPQLKNASSGKLPSRHMRLAHMASNHMSFHGTRNPSLFNGEYKTESLASMHDQLSNRANFHYGLSGLKNEIWPSSPKRDDQPRLFTDVLPSAVSLDNLDEVLKGKSRSSSISSSAFRTEKQESDESHLEKAVVATTDDKLQRFLRLSDSQAEAKAKSQRDAETKSNLNRKAEPNGGSDTRQSNSSGENEQKNASWQLSTSQANSKFDIPFRTPILSKVSQQGDGAQSSMVNGDDPLKGTKSRFYAPKSDLSMESTPSHEDPVKHFLRLCRKKRSKEIDEDTHGTHGTHGGSIPVELEGANEKIKRFLQLSKLSSKRNVIGDQSSLSIGSTALSQTLHDLERSDSFVSKSSLRQEQTLSRRRNISQNSMFSEQRMTPKTSKGSDKDKLKRFLSLSSNNFIPPPPKTAERNPDAPPIKEISVVTNGPIAEISLCGDLVKEVFPYHVVLDSDFRILQVGNSLSMLFEDIEEEEEDSPPQPEINFIGRVVSDIFMVTGPIPMFGQWDWSVLDRMKEKTIFFESVLTDESTRKAKLKGTIIEMFPRQIMLSLLPNVKNVTELSNMDLSMGDLPLHSCQREAVLLGEHSASEVKLTNHLDMLHRDLIDSMEQQIKDRTTELAMANQDLERANTQIQQQSARQLEHFACMSHEIRTPLNCIVGMSSILLEESDAKVEVDPMHAESIQMIYTSGELLRAVVDDVLDYAKLESGSFEVDVSKINLQESLAGVVHSITQKIQEKNIRLRCYYSATLPKFTETDSRRVQQVLFNLLGNSGKFSKRNSVIDLCVSLIPKTKRKEESLMAVGGLENAAELDDHDIIRFSVKDYGKGIAKKDFTTIFKPFSQASKHTATVYGGTGLGLSITSKLVNRLGGIISLESEFGKFAEFIVDLPFKGEPVNTEKLKKRLTDVFIVVVQPTIRYDYSFTSFPIDQEPSPFGHRVVDQYGLDVSSFESLPDLIGKLQEGKSIKVGKHFAILVDENLYNENQLVHIAEQIGPRNCTLMTFGPNYEIEATKQRHFRSLLGVFPSILLDSIANHVTRTKQEVFNSAIDLCSPNGSRATSKGIFEAFDEVTDGMSVAVNDGLRKMADPQREAKAVATDASANAVDEKPRSRPQPSSKGTNITKKSENNKPTPPDRNLKVLLAEDNKINQKVMSRVLTRVGIKDITVVDDGLKAVNISEKEKFDIIFMDMQMPVMDGMEATNIIVARDKDAKIIFVTAHALDEFKHKADAAGAVSFISKPFQVQDIERVLSELGYD